MPFRGFLWVNKDPTSKSLSNSRGLGESVNVSHVARHAQLNAQRSPTRSQTTHLPPTRNSVSPPSRFRIEKHTTRPQKPRRRSNGPKKPIDEGVEDVEAVQNARVPSPSRAIDSCGSQIIKLGPAEHSILQYCRMIWMPTSYSALPKDCHFTFTRFWPGDDHVSFQVVQGALQAPDAVSLYALLAASSQRMRYINHINIGDQVPDRFMLQAVRALRHRVADSTAILTQRLVLDLSWLVLYELFNSTTKRNALFWHMMQDAIAYLGGLQNLETFTALTAISCDYLKAVAILEPCAIDPYDKPRLVGLGSNDEEQGIKSEDEEQVATVLNQLDSRVRLAAQEAHAYDRMLQTVQVLPASALRTVSATVSREAMSVYNFPFTPTRDEKPTDSNEALFPIEAIDGGRNASGEEELTIDTIPVLCRHKAVRIWAYFSVVAASQRHVAQETDYPAIGTETQLQPPMSILEDLSYLSQNLWKVPRLLAGIGWAIRKDFMLWMSAVGLLASLTQDGRFTFVDVFQRQATTMGIKSKSKMEELFACQLPVDLIQEKALSILWEVIESS